MKKHVFIILLLLGISLIGAQTVTGIRSLQNMRFSGKVITDAANNTWVLWEELQLGRYRLYANKFNSLGHEVSGFPKEISLRDDSTRLYEAVASDEFGILLSYSYLGDENRVNMKLQKLFSNGQPMWADGGFLIAEDIDIKRDPVALCANNLGGAFVIVDEALTNAQGPAILRGMNLDSDGTNVWTAPQEITHPSTGKVKQLILADNGHLIMSLTGANSQSFHMIDNSGNLVGNDPLFGQTDLIPYSARMLKAPHGMILLFQDSNVPDSNLGLQLIDADFQPVFSSIKSIWAPPFPLSVQAQNMNDGGFVLIYHSPVSDVMQMHAIRSFRLDADLNEVWPSWAETIVSGHTLRALDTVVDLGSNLWITANVVNGTGNDGRVMLAMIDQNGNQVFHHQSVSSEIQAKASPRLARRIDVAQLFWMEHADDFKVMKRQIFDSQGNEYLAENGEVYKSVLAGEPSGARQFTLGNRSVYIWSETRGIDNRYYLQILDETMTPLLQENGDVLEVLDNLISLEAISKKDELSIALVYTKPDPTGGRKLYYQEIDADGLEIYPDGGILISEGEGPIYQSELGFEYGDSYLFWNAYHDNPFLPRKLKGQRISDGIPQWEHGGRELYFHPNLGGIRAAGRTLAFDEVDLDSGIRVVKALRFTHEGEIDPTWGEEPILLFDDSEGTHAALMTYLISHGDSYVCFSSKAFSSERFRAQRISQEGDLLWGNSGIMIGNPTAIFDHRIMSIHGNDQISLFSLQEHQGAYLHKIDASGTLQFGMAGLQLPGRITGFDTTLVRHADGRYSYFGRDVSQPYHTLKHIVLSSNGSVQQIQDLHRGAIHSSAIQAELAGGQIRLSWTERYIDDLSYTQSSSFSLYALSVPEPTSAEDLTAEYVPGLIISQNAPNPFYESTTIEFKLIEAAPVQLEIFNIKGQLIYSQRLSGKERGDHQITWEGVDNTGNKCAGGMYLYRIKSGRHSAGKKMILLR